MAVRADVTKFKGGVVHLLGNPAKVGDKALDFRVRKGLAPDSEVTLHSFAGKNLLISFSPSLDTSVCATQIRKFNEKAASLPNTTILTITMDLPPAQGRFCTTEGISNLTVASDYVHKSFGLNYGVLIEELQVTARGVFVIDKNGVIQYVEITKEVTEEPNYDAAIEAAKKLG